MHRVGVKLVISAIAVALIALRIRWPAVTIDSTSVALLVVALLPWVWELIESAEFPGGLKFRFRQVESEQERQKAEIHSLKFLVSHFLTESELTHLMKFESPGTFEFQPSAFFERELRHLRALGLIAGHEGKGIRTLLREQGDAKTHFFITDRGFEYLRLRREVEENSNELDH